jgi:hypothetical protein
VLATITFGLNETIKRLERARLDLEISVDALLAGHADFPFSPGSNGLIPTAPAAVAGPSRLGTPPPPPLRVIFVCVHDINPRELVDHVPRYVASWNALLARSRARLEEWARAGDEERREKMERLLRDKELWLVPLIKGSEQVLAHAVGLRRVSVMGVTVSRGGWRSVARLTSPPERLSQPIHHHRPPHLGQAATTHASIPPPCARTILARNPHLRPDTLESGTHDDPSRHQGP